MLGLIHYYFTEYSQLPNRRAAMHYTMELDLNTKSQITLRDLTRALILWLGGKNLNDRELIALFGTGSERTNYLALKHWVYERYYSNESEPVICLMQVKADFMEHISGLVIAVQEHDYTKVTALENLPQHGLQNHEIRNLAAGAELLLRETLSPEAIGAIPVFLNYPLASPTLGAVIEDWIIGRNYQYTFNPAELTVQIAVDLLRKLEDVQTSLA